MYHPGKSVKIFFKVGTPNVEIVKIMLICNNPLSNLKKQYT